MAILLALIVSFFGCTVAPPTLYQRQGQDVYCYMYTANNLIQQALYDPDLVYKLGKIMDADEKAKWPRNVDLRREFVSYTFTGTTTTGSALILGGGQAEAAYLYVPMFAIAGFAFGPNADPIALNRFSHSVWYNE